MTPLNSQGDWETTTKSGLVPIGTHSLYLSVSGLRRQPGQPLIVVLAGSGDTTASYPAVERLVSPFARILLYDRSGLGRSEDGPNHINAVVAAEELHAALDAARISPPLVLLAHSYGGMVAREYLHLYSADVAGMVLADAGTERQCQYFNIPDPNIMAVLGDLKFAQVTGLRADSKISRDEWRARAIEMPRGMAASQEEGRAFIKICQTLAEKKQLEHLAMEDRPVSVIKCHGAGDYQKIYDAGVAAGNGTEPERKAFAELLGRWDDIDTGLKEDQLRLSSKSHYVDLKNCGHNVQLLRPDVVADEVKWVLDNAIKRTAICEHHLSHSAVL